MAQRMLADDAPKDALIARVDGRLVDLTRGAAEFGSANVEFPAPDDPDVLHVMRHSAAHVLAQAVVRLIPEAKYAKTPWIES